MQTTITMSPLNKRLALRLSSRLVLILALSLHTAGAAMAGSISGADLLEMCNPKGVDPVFRLKVSECRGYVVGVADTFDCSHPMGKFAWNSTSNPQQSDLVKIALNWLASHPQYLGYQANGLVAAALSDKYPCPTKQTEDQSGN